jgi:hypothetical protein
VGPETKGSVLVVHHGDNNHNHLYYHSVVAKGINKTSRAKMSKLQRLASLGITGAIRTTPTAAVGCSPGAPSPLVKDEG